MTPYTTRTGLQIGRCYIPPLMPVIGDAVAIQSALLAKPTRLFDARDKIVIISCALAAVCAVFSVVVRL